MLFADAALSSAVVSATAALAAMSSAGTLPKCAAADARAAAVYAAMGSLASTSSTTSFDLSAAGLVSKLVISAASRSCEATSATLASADVAALAQQADALHQAAVASLSLTTPLGAAAGGAAIDLASVMPLTALEAAARALYVVQAKGTAAVAAVASGNAQAVAQLVAGAGACSLLLPHLPLTPSYL